MHSTRISWFLSSNPALGNVETSPSGGLFTCQLNEPYQIPQNASNVTLCLLQAIVWNSQINIVDGVNNKFYYRVNATNTVVSIPQGTYDLTLLSEALEAAMFRNVPSVPVGSMSIFLKGAYANIGLVVRGGFYISQLQFGQPDDMSRSLGFDPGNYTYTNLPTIGYGQDFTSQSAPPIKDGARELLLGSTLVARGMRVNDSFKQVLAKINFGNTPPNSQLIFQPPVMNKVPCELGSGRTITTVQCFLTRAETGELYATNGEYWSFVAQLEYEQPLYVDQSKKRKVG